MNRLLGLFFILFFGNVANGQQFYIDSISAILDKYPQQDTGRLTLLKWLSFYYKDVNPERGIAIADSSIEFAPKIDQVGNHIAALYVSKGVNYWMLGDNVPALANYKIAVDIFTKTKNLQSLANVTVNIANSYLGMAYFDSAIVNLQMADSFFVKQGDLVRQLKVNNNIGSLLLYQAKFPQALRHFNIARKIYETTGLDDPVSASSIYGNIGIVYDNLKKPQDAILFYKKAMEYDELIGNKSGIAINLVNIGKSYHNMEKTDSATLAFESAAISAREAKLKHIEINSLVNVTSIFLKTAAYAKALNAITAALDMVEDDAPEASSVYNVYGKTLMALPEGELLMNGFSKASRASMAEQYSQKALVLADKNQMAEAAFKAWENLSYAYESQGQFAKALHAYQQFSTIRDSVFNVEKRQDVALQEATYEFEIKEGQMKIAAIEQQNKERQKRNWIISAAVLGLLATVGYNRYRQRLKEEKSKRHEIELRADKAEAEIKMLLAQINPHFVFNALTGINAEIINSGDIAQRLQFINQLAKLIRMVLEASEEKTISLRRDVEILELYLQLEQKNKQNFNYNIVIDENVKTSDIVLPPMLFQPIVENSIRHGFGKKKDGYISIEVKKQGASLLFNLTDNGIDDGSEDKVTQPGKEKSMGLDITRKRIEMLGSETSLHIFKNNNGTTATIQIPLILN